MYRKICLVLVSLFGCVAPHGFLLKPPQRSSMWRQGFNTPPNFNDNGLNCGGTGYQFEQQNGKCGVCGDPYGVSEKENEAGGKYATGIIAANYKSGDSIDVEVMITANHLGHFQFRLCPHNDFSTPVSQDCLDNHPLAIETDQGQVTQYRIGSDRGIYKMTVKLPAGMTCTQCVLQWTYTAGNNWGCTGTDCGLGKGPQEHFVNCADIAISPRDEQEITQAPPATEAPPATQAPPATEAPPMPALATGCQPVGIWAQVTGMAEWCDSNCNHIPPYCPPSHCICT